MLVDRVSFACVLFVECLCMCGHVVGASEKPNIILIVADDLGWNDVGFHGSNQIPTPNIDALAYNGLILNKHYVLPVCTPSRASLMTGKYAIRTGLQGDPGSSDSAWALPIEERILPQYLKEKGYKTHLVGKWHLGFYKTKYTPIKRGFDSHYGYYNGWIRYNDSVTSTGSLFGIDARRNFTRAGTEFRGKYATDVFTDEAVQLIKNHDQNYPLFLEISHVAVHAEKRDGLKVRNIEENDRKFGYIKDEKRRLYAGVLDALDESVGRVMKALASSHLLDNSIVLFISDNGGATIDPDWKFANTASNWPLRGTKTSLYEGGIRGTAAFWSSHLKWKNNVTNELFHISDWLPTFFAAAGGNSAQIPNIDGINQWDFLTGVKSQSDRKEVLVNINSERNNSAIIYRNWKLMHCDDNHVPTFADDYVGDSGRDEMFYDLESVLQSPAQKVIQEAFPPPTTNVTETFLDVRNSAIIDMKCRQRIKDGHKIRVVPCKGNRLYNIEKDPCEYYNAENTAPDIVDRLRARIEYFQSVSVPMQRFPADPQANPVYFGNYWSPWLDEDEESSSIPSLIFNSACVVLIAICIRKLL